MLWELVWKSATIEKGVAHAVTVVNAPRKMHRRIAALKYLSIVKFLSQVEEFGELRGTPKPCRLRTRKVPVSQ